MFYDSLDQTSLLRRLLWSTGKQPRSVWGAHRGRAPLLKCCPPCSRQWICFKQACSYYSDNVLYNSLSLLGEHLHSLFIVHHRLFHRIYIPQNISTFEKNMVPPCKSAGPPTKWTHPTGLLVRHPSAKEGQGFESNCIHLATPLNKGDLYIFCRLRPQDFNRNLKVGANRIYIQIKSSRNKSCNSAFVARLVSTCDLSILILNLCYLKCNLIIKGHNISF